MFSTDNPALDNHLDQERDEKLEDCPECDGIGSHTFDDCWCMGETEHKGFSHDPYCPVQTTTICRNCDGVGFDLGLSKIKDKQEYEKFMKRAAEFAEHKRTRGY